MSMFLLCTRMCRSDCDKAERVIHIRQYTVGAAVCLLGIKEPCCQLGCSIHPAAVYR
jgi:hypothetical protein